MTAWHAEFDSLMHTSELRSVTFDCTEAHVAVSEHVETGTAWPEMNLKHGSERNFEMDDSLIAD